MIRGLTARRLPLAFAALLALALLVGAGPARAAGAIQPKTSLPVIERQVMCVTCKIPLNVAQSPQADRERAFIQRLIDEGRGEQEIKRALVGQYGASVLGLPEAGGFDLTVYLVPIAVVAALIGLLAVLLPKWRRRTPAHAVAGAGAAPLGAADSARLESDMARYE
ncbi:MAG: cytochrome c-type biogenesis protein CcmH [Solirubrobacteraceae bacterium]